MLTSKIVVLGLLLLIFAQDLRSRSVHWVLFPLLLLGLLIIRLDGNTSFPDFLKSILINLGFLLLQLLVLTLYFSFRNKKWINITSELLGLGDILFFLVVAFYLTSLNFLSFFITSLIGTLLTWLSWQIISPTKNKYIPLAGFQSLFFSLFLAGDWWFWHFDLTNDTWLLNLIGK